MTVLALQYYDGDKAAAMRTARLIADLQDGVSKSHKFMFVPRFDSSLDEETVHYVARKFSVLTHKSRRREIGWPAGCNGVAHDIIMLALERHRSGEWAKVDGVWLLESDILPLKKNWLEEIEREWREALAAKKLLMGAWSPHHGEGFGHVNGNLIFHPTLAARVQGMEGSAPHIGWDVYHARKLQRHWWKSRQMINLYHARGVSKEQLWPEGEPYSFVHGIKDSSGHRLVREKLFPVSI